MANEFSRAELDHPQNNQTNEAEETTNQILLDAVMRSVMMSGIKPPTEELNEHGQIKHMEMPGGWQAGPDYSKRLHSGTYQEFHPPGQEDCQLGFYYRGRRTSESAGELFKNTLDQEPHQLSGAEYASLQEIVRDKAKSADFTLKGAHTEELNGKMVLVVEGRYNANQNDAKHVFLDADGTGTAVQELFFQAPKDKFGKYIGASDRAMKTINWK